MRIPRIEADTTAVWQKLQAITACPHPSHTPRKKVASNGVATVWKQCDKCGVKLEVIRKKALSQSEIDSLPEWDDIIEKDFYEARQQLHSQMLDEAKAEAREEWKQRYASYLQTPAWRERRRMVILRAQGICEGCRQSEATEVHHLTYRDVGEEFLFQLVALCKPCHERYHTQPDEPI